VRRFRKLLLCVLAAPGAVVVGGCDLGAEFIPARAVTSSNDQAPPASAPPAQSSSYLTPGYVDLVDFILFLEEQFRSGRLIPTGPGTARVEDKTVTGQGRLDLIEPSVTLDLARRGASAAAIRRFNVSRPRFAARFDGTTNANTGRGTMNGVAVARFPSRSAGIACISFRANLTNRGANARGSFRTIGGTRAAARVRSRGAFTQTVVSQGPQTSLDRDVGRVASTVGRRRGLPARCRALLPLL
jgi:hypothetical protein